MTDPNTQQIPGTYRGTMNGVHYYNPKSGLWAFVDSSNDFYVGWKIQGAQLAHLLNPPSGVPNIQ